jgi:hypothetical protein
MNIARRLGALGQDMHECLSAYVCIRGISRDDEDGAQECI